MPDWQRLYWQQTPRGPQTQRGIQAESQLLIAFGPSQWDSVWVALTDLVGCCVGALVDLTLLPQHPDFFRVGLIAWCGVDPAENGPFEVYKALL